LNSSPDEMTCSICLDYFKDPVSLDCDHSFCRSCITQFWGGFATDVSCPQCRAIFPQRNLRLNRQLRNIVEAARELRLQTGREPEPERLCEKHKEPLKLFCKEDEIPICLVCDRSKEHRDHTVIPAEEAAEEFKVGIYCVCRVMTSVWACLQPRFPSRHSCHAVLYHHTTNISAPLQTGVSTELTPQLEYFTSDGRCFQESSRKITRGQQCSQGVCSLLFSDA
uniref:Zinc finger protein RFP n=1 Tax=Chelydra serpentina TaxID=8475 RepID=A0A8C3T9L6_CHESE